MKETRKDFLFSWLIRLIGCFLIGLMWLMIVRLAFAIQFVPRADAIAFKNDLPRAFFNGFRFDLQTMAYFSLLPLLTLCLSLPFPAKKRREGIGRFFKIYFSIVAFLIGIFACIDYGFYKNFHSHINDVFFDFFNEGPWGLTLFIWQEYPVLKMLSVIMGMCILTYQMVKLILRKTFVLPYSMGWISFSLFLLVYLTATFFFLRGGFGMYPLQVEDTRVSANEKINLLATNSFYELKCSYKVKKCNFTPLVPPLNS